MITSTPKQMVAPQLLAGAVATLYTVTAPVKYAKLREIRLVNTDTAAKAVTIYLVPSGGTPSAANMLYDATTVQASPGAEPANYSHATVLKVGDMIQAFADVASKVSICISGVEYT